VGAIDAYLRQNNKYQKNESKLTWNDVEDCLVLVSNNFSTQTSYENQTKKAITNKFVQEAMTDFLRSNLEVYFIENRFDAEKIAEQVLINKRSRESAEKARLNIKKKLSGSIDIANRVQKFVDCRSRDAARREIYIVEGDSALGSVKLSRDAEYQGIMPVRGKILNCLKADYGKIFGSDIITDLIKVLGCGVEVESKQNKDLNAFDLDNLRWNKVVICTDGDVDGFQIRTLILTMLYRLCPTLIREGYVYIAETPLFEINCGDKTWFAYSDKEKADIVKEPGGQEGQDRPLQGPGRERPGHDVADHHEPKPPGGSSRSARRRGGDRPGLRPAAGGQPPGPQGPHRQRGLQTWKYLERHPPPRRSFPARGAEFHRTERRSAP
jgi:DNA gyrase subunit B